MIPLPLVWTLLTVSLWKAGSCQITATLQQEPAKVLYPKIPSTEVIDCDCANIDCDQAFWFRSSSDHSDLKFIGKCNNADRATYGPGVETQRFKMSKKSNAFVLRIVNVSEMDAGIYSCVLKNRNNAEMWKPGVLLRPGVIPPTVPPTIKPKPPFKSVCRCTKKKSQDGCGYLVLWPMVGLISVLALALLCTLYYFSRLPKKCRHHFAKKRQIN